MSAVQSYEVSVQFSDGDIAVFPVTSNETILEGALKADVPILNQCQSGSCGSCRLRKNCISRESMLKPKNKL